MLTRHTRHDHLPANDARLASLLDAAAAPAAPGPVAGEEAALAAFRAAPVRATGWRSRMHLPTTPFKTLGVAAAGAGLLVTGGGLAAAAAGELPGAAQQKAHDLLAEIDVQVPTADERSEARAVTRGGSEVAPPASGGTDAPSTLPDTAGFGQMISELARSTEGGREKGQTISTAASSKSEDRAGEHGSEQAPEQPAAGSTSASGPGAASEGAGGQSGSRARVETPNDGGTTTADGASAGAGGTDGSSASVGGTATAGEMSDGRSTHGSDNAP